MRRRQYNTTFIVNPTIIDNSTTADVCLASEIKQDPSLGRLNCPSIRPFLFHYGIFLHWNVNGSIRHEVGVGVGALVAVVAVEAEREGFVSSLRETTMNGTSTKLY